MNPASTVLTSAAGVLSVPLTVATLGAQTLTAQLVTPGIKGQQQTVHNPGPLSLLQVPGSQQTLPLLGAIPRQVGHAQSGTVSAAGTATVHNQQLHMALQKQLQHQAQHAHSSAGQPGGGRQRNRKRSTSGKM